MARLTPCQERSHRIDQTIMMFGIMYFCDHESTIKELVRDTGVSARTISRIRSGERGATRKPMGGDRRSGRHP